MVSPVSRRSFSGLLAGLSAGVASRTLGLAQPAPPYYDTGPYGVKECSATTQCSTAAPQGPRIPEYKAMRLLLRDPSLRALLESKLFEDQAQLVRHPDQIDPDLQAKRSFSSMAKTVFQRQRNVARILDQHTRIPDYEEGSPGSLIQSFVRRAMWGRD
jgi:hypothetical protein